MTATFIHLGDAIDFVPTTDLLQGAVVVQESLVGITNHSIKANRLGTLQLRGVFDLPKESGSGKAIATGKKCYWHEADQVVTTTATGAKFLGHCVRDAGDNDERVRVRLAAAG